MCTKHNCTFEIHVSRQKWRTCERLLFTAFHRWGFHVADTQSSNLFPDLRSEPLISGKADRRWACSDSATCASPCLCLCACVWVGRQLPAAIQIDEGKPWVSLDGDSFNLYSRNTQTHTFGSLVAWLAFRWRLHLNIRYLCVCVYEKKKSCPHATACTRWQVTSSTCQTKRWRREMAQQQQQWCRARLESLSYFWMLHWNIRWKQEIRGTFIWTHGKKSC